MPRAVKDGTERADSVVEMTLKPASTKIAPSAPARRGLWLAGVLSVLLLLTQARPAFTVDAGFLRDFPESGEVRARVFDEWLAEELARVLLLQPTRLTDRFGNAFLVRNEKSKDGAFLRIIVSPDRAGARVVRGTWVLSRRLTDGMPASISVYPVDNPNIVVTVTADGASPETGRSRLSLEAWGRSVRTGVPVGVPLVKLYTMDMSAVVSMTRSTVPWAVLSPDTYRYVDLARMVETVRARIGSLVYLEDGAFDERGRPVYIRDGSAQKEEDVLAAALGTKELSSISGGVNCSGFAKWIIDGMVRPVTGSGTKIASLMGHTSAPETHFTESYRERRDLFFALDWTRHLASAALSLSSWRTVRPDSSGVDVKLEPFSGLHGHEQNVGYRVTDALPLLYWLSLVEPGHLYLGAVSREVGEPALRTYHHIAVFMPYFDADGQFACAVFENAEETSIEAFTAANRDAWVHLVRVRAPETGRFAP